MSYDDGGYNGFGGSQVMGGGGGHFASPSQGTMAAYGGGGGSGGGAKKRDPQSLTRVTVKQCNDATELPGDKYMIDGRHVTQVCFVANVLSCATHETNVQLSVEDGTGTLSVRMYRDSDAGDEPLAIREGEYRLIVGSLKKIGGARCVVAFTLAPVTDHNALTMHYLDVIHSHLRATHGPPQPKGANGVNGFAGGMMMKPEGHMMGGGGHMEHMGGAAAGGMMHGGGGMHAGGMGMGMGGAPGAGGSVRDQVLHVFQYGRGSESDNGCSVADVCAQLSHIPPNQIHEAVVALSDDGHLYSTIDEEHFKTTAQ